MPEICILHGPNLNLLGEREPQVYGYKTLKDIEADLQVLGDELGVSLRFFQSNHEGVLIDRIHDARLWSKGILINPGGFTHTSVALRDAVASITIPVVEVHLSNISAREPFRHISLLTPVCAGIVAGFGWKSYLYGLRALVGMVTG
jgi:3-dehydroquinate dehydratase-2